MMRIEPLTLSEAREFVGAHHRHNKPPIGHRFSIGLFYIEPSFNEELLSAVVIVGRPVARKINYRATAEITRLCTAPWAPRNACSLLYRAAWRSWREMGGVKIITYTLQSEPGDSLRGAGFLREEELQAKNGLNWTTRVGREDQSVVRQAKIRWSISRKLDL